MNNLYCEKDLLAKYGQIIKKHRRLKGYSQEKFALSIGMDRTYYATVENGKRNISLKNIQKTSKGLEISTSEIFKEIEEL